MKRWISLLLAVCVLAGMLAVPVCAATKVETNEADALNSLGLFLGMTTGYGLDYNLTRDQSAMLLVRMLGALDEAETGKYTHPFNDVAPWASNVVAYAFAKGLVKGYGATRYGGSDTVTDFQYLTIVLRALGYTDNGENDDFFYRTSRKLGKQLGLVDSEADDENFTRGEAVDIFWRALNTKLKGQEKTLAQQLIEQKVFTEEEFALATEYAKNGRPKSESDGKADDKSDDKTDDKSDDSSNGGSGSGTTGEKKLEDTTWEEYLNMSDAEKDAFFEKFATPAKFFEWKEKAEAAYKEGKNVIEVGKDGTVDLGDLVGNN